jgi:hypothetical protein
VIPTPLHLCSLNAGDMTRAISFTEGRWMRTVPGSDGRKLFPRSRRSAFAGLPCAVNHTISQGTKRPIMQRRTGAPGLTRRVSSRTTAGRSSTQFKPQKFEKAPSKTFSPWREPISSFGRTLKSISLPVPGKVNHAGGNVAGNELNALFREVHGVDARAAVQFEEFLAWREEFV